MNITVGDIRYSTSYLNVGNMTVREDDGPELQLTRPTEEAAIRLETCFTSDCDCDTEEGRNTLRWIKGLISSEAEAIQGYWLPLDHRMVERYRELTRLPEPVVADAELKDWIQDNVEVNLLSWFGAEDTTDAERALGFASVIQESERRFEAMTEQIVRIADLDMQLADAKAGQGIAALEEQVAFLTARLEASQENLRLSRERHQRDVTTIGDALMEEANNRDWCTQYDSFVSDLNESLHHELPTRSRTYNVEVTITISVNASDYDDAREQATEELRDARLRDYNWSIGEVELDD